MRRSRFDLVPLTIISLALACDQSPDPVAPETGTPSFSRVSHAGWDAPVNLGPVVNSPFVDNLPELSKDKLSLYFTSARPGFGGLDLWVSQRESEDAPWGIPVNLGPTVNSSATDAAPNLSRDEHYLFITSDRPGGLGSNDIWVSWRQDVHDDFGWTTPVNLGAPINSAAFEAGAAFHRPEFYFVRGPGPFAVDIYVSSVRGQRFTSPTVVQELSSPASDQRPTLRHDRREIFFSSNRTGGFGQDDIWTSTRPNASGRWSSPTNLGPVINTSFIESQPGLSKDGTMLFFSSDRPGGSGGLDLYVSTRRDRARR
jgi:hypothetical protein